MPPGTELKSAHRGDHESDRMSGEWPASAGASQVLDGRAIAWPAFHISGF